MLAPLLVCLPLLSHEALDRTQQNLAIAFAGQSFVVATADSALPTTSALTTVGYVPASPNSSTLVAADFLTAHSGAQQHQAKAILILGSESESLNPDALRSLANAVLGKDCDLAVPRYVLPARSGLLNSAILYPLSRALFGTAVRFPLAIDLALSCRMAERLAATAQHFTAVNQPDALIWPVAEAAVAGYAISQVNVGDRVIPQPTGADFNTILARITGSLFADVDSKAAFWQRARIAPTTRSTSLTPPFAVSTPEDLRPMVDAFRLAYGNLAEIWALILPPQSLLGLKRLSVMPPESFSMPDSLWTRIVYDFLLAYRLRTINRSHLLGALSPLYLAWVASHILLTNAGTEPERHIEALAAAFEADKPYFVSRWRWPDRFNP